MQLKRSKNKAETVSKKQVENLSGYIKYIVDIYSACEISREFWLTDREKVFFIATVINVINGDINPISDNSMQIYKKLFGPTTNKMKISDYINRIRKKNWVRYNKKTKEVQLPPIFHNITEGGDEMVFNISLTWKD